MTDTLEQKISEIVSARFPGTVVDTVSVTPDVDNDGDRVLRVTIVFAAEVAGLAARELASLVRHIRPMLEEREESGFPILRIMTKRDHDRLQNEAA